MQGEPTGFADSEYPQVRLDDGRLVSLFRAEIRALLEAEGLNVGQCFESIGHLTP